MIFQYKLISFLNVYTKIVSQHMAPSADRATNVGTSLENALHQNFSIFTTYHNLTLPALVYQSYLL